MMQHVAHVGGELVAARCEVVGTHALQLLHFGEALVLSGVILWQGCVVLRCTRNPSFSLLNFLAACGSAVCDSRSSRLFWGGVGG